MKNKTIQVLEGSMDEFLYKLGHGEALLTMTQNL